MTTKTTFKVIWETLSKVNVNEHTQTKSGGKVDLTYLSWAMAWKILMKYFPQATYKNLPKTVYPDGSVEVGVSVDIDGCIREMTLPVMNYANAVIINPNSWQTNTAKMRCLVKCIAMFGLAIYIYSGEDLPDKNIDEEVQIIDKAMITLQKAKNKKTTYEKLVKEGKINDKTDTRQLAKAISVA